MLSAQIECSVGLAARLEVSWGVVCAECSVGLAARLEVSWGVVCADRV